MKLRDLWNRGITTYSVELLPPRKSKGFEEGVYSQEDFKALKRVGKKGKKLCDLVDALSVTEGAGLPSSRPSIIYIGKTSKLKKILSYTKKNRTLSITGLPELVNKGVSFGVGLEKKKLKILLNISSSQDEKIVWNSAVLKMATKYK